ncbi:MAG: alpha/beta hydrolase [Bacteroidales bacterium]|nr:alpha/beta hydrolase [Bacteroidales bacterium]
MGTVPTVLFAQTTYETKSDIAYISTNETDAYRKERCKLDMYYPQGATDFPTIVWFHGGGLTGGNKSIPTLLQEQGVAVVAVNYRLSPKATHPAYIEDAAEALAWVYDHIEAFGGNKRKLFVSGHSAGGYLSLILALDKHYLAQHGLDADQLTAYFPISGQTVTHFTIRAERQLRKGIPVIDEYAPVWHARKDTAPIFLITGNRDLEMADRLEENALLYSVLKNQGNTVTQLYELDGCDHGTVVDPALCIMLNRIRKWKYEK